MSERKVLNKYYPPDFDPSKLKRRKGINKDKQMVIRLMAPFSMRCNRCAEYIYKGKKFNARKETAVDEEYFGIKIFRFYIKCTQCSSEITFKTDPKNADYTMEHGATRNFENWSETNASNRTAIPDAAADDDYDSDGNPREDRAQKDAMADLERSQEQSMREMELMDELAELRQRNARVETNNADPETLLAQLHTERANREEEERRAMEQEEDDQLVAQYFAKVPMGPPAIPSLGKGKGKGKEKALAPPGIELDEAVEGSDDGSEDEEGQDGPSIPAPALTIKRRPPPSESSGSGITEPSVASILAAKGKVLENGAATGNGPGNGAQAQVAAKRKREGMQKMLGIKKKK